MQCYAQVLRDLRSGGIVKPDDRARSQTANEGLRGLGRCFRWIRDSCPTSVVVPTARPDVLADEALELLRWGVDYDPLFNHHSAYSRQLIEVDVDEDNRTITFLPACDVNPRFFCTQTEAKRADDERRAQEFPEQRLAELSKCWFDSAVVTRRGFHFDDSTINDGGAIDVAVEWLKRTCLPELPEGTLLVSCTVADVRRVLAALYVYALFGTRLEEVADQQGLRMASRVIEFHQADMVNWVSRLSDMAKDRVEAIISLLTFDPQHDHGTLTQQPFVGSRSGSLFLLPRMFLLIDLPRMCVGALNRTKVGQRAYATAINAIEENGVRTVVEELRRGALGRFEIAEKRTFRTLDGREMTPDTLVVAAQSQEALIIDMKYATPPFSLNDIQHDLAEMAVWQKRMGEYVAAFEAEPQMLQQHFAVDLRGGMSVHGLILLRWPLPLPIGFRDEVHAVDWPSLQEHLQEISLGTIGELISWVGRRPDLGTPKLLAWKTKEVQVREWRYRYSVLVPVLPEHLYELTRSLAHRLWEERGRPLWDDQSDWFKAEARLFESEVVEL